MSETLYPTGYGVRLVTFDVLRDTFEPRMHPAGAVRFFNFIYHQGGKFGAGGGFRVTQPVKPGFAKPGRSFHQKQKFPSGEFYVAIDMVVVNPGYKHRAPRWDEVPRQGTPPAIAYGWHANVGTPGSKGNEPWHGQPVPLDGWDAWVRDGRYDLDYNYPIEIFTPREQPPQPPVPTTPQPPVQGVIVEFTSRVITVGARGNDVKFWQNQLNDVGNQGLYVDGWFADRSSDAVKNWQIFFGLPVTGELDARTQRSIIEMALLAG